MSGNAPVQPTPGELKAVNIHVLSGVPAEPEEFSGYEWRAHLDNASLSHQAMREVLRFKPEESLRRLRTELPSAQAELVNPYASESRVQAWFCPQGCKAPPLEVQAQRLEKAFDGFKVKFPDEAQELAAPERYSTHGIALWPVRAALGKVLRIREPQGKNYGRLVEHACDVINASSDMLALTNYRHGELTEKYIRVEPATNEWLTHLENQAWRNGKGCTCLAYHVNYGDWGVLNEKGQPLTFSPRSAAWQCLNYQPRRLPIDPAAGLSLYIGNPAVLNEYGQQWKWFPGAQYNWKADGEWSSALFLDFYDSKLGLGAYGAHSASGYCGSVVAFPGV